MSNVETNAPRRHFGLSPSLVQLSSVRFKEFIREPEALFWTFAFPVLLAIGLGIAFRNRPAEVVHIAVVGSAPDAARVATAARADKGLAVEQLPADSASVALRTGRVALLVLPQLDGSMQYQFDETRPDARTARLLVDDAIQRGSGRSDVVKVSESHVRERGSRYIDFVIPGLLGMNIMGSSIWGLGYTIVDARRKKLLKRLVATPMSRAEFLISYLVSRIALLVGEVVVLLGFAILFFGVPMRGSLLQLVSIILVSTFAFGGLGLLIASRARTIEGASGLMNVTMMPMWVLSGVFFSSENFPRPVQPFIQALPLTATNNALRASMLRGAGWTTVGPEVALLALWSVATLWLALKWFRWR
jgi:ABC-type multidrug transport system permease subunit